MTGYSHKEISNSNAPHTETEEEQEEKEEKEEEEEEKEKEEEQEEKEEPDREAYFPVNKIRGRHVYPEAVRYLEHLGYQIQCTEEEYYALKSLKRSQHCVLMTMDCDMYVSQI